MPGIEVDTSLPAERVIDLLERLRLTRGLPETITVDNGPEFTSHALDQWAYARGLKLAFINPGKPLQNAFVESFNGTFHFDCLDATGSAAWSMRGEPSRVGRANTNEIRLHGSIGNQTPVEYAAAVTVASRASVASALDLTHRGEEIHGIHTWRLT
jgi:putative transposase